MFDYLSSNIFMPLGGLLIAIFVGYFNTRKNIQDELSNKGRFQSKAYVSMFLFIIRYITPVLVFIVSLYSIGIIKV